ncbi:peptide hydrolase, partial [Trypanosoma cruzi]
DGRGRSKQERHTRLHRMHVRRERSVVSAPLTEGAHTHKKVQRTQQHNSKVTIQKEIPAHHADCWSTGSAANIHHKATLQLPSVFAHIQRTPLHAGRPPPQQPHTQK